MPVAGAAQYIGELTLARGLLLRWGAWASVLLLLAVMGWAGLSALWPAGAHARTIVATAPVVVGGAEQRLARLHRDSDRWEGIAAAFPPRSVAHFEPEGSPGLFLVRGPDGTFHAFTDRSAHPYGERLHWREPLERYSGWDPGGWYANKYGWNAGLEDRHTLYVYDGTPLSGPGPWLGRHQVSIEGERVVVARFARCPAGWGELPKWCAR
jgi:hypothetical protein